MELTDTSVSIPARSKPRTWSKEGNGSLSPLAKSPPTSSTIEYASSAPAAATKHAADGTEDEAIPDHLYEKLPRNFLAVNGAGKSVPDYLRMILMCEFELTL